MKDDNHMIPFVATRPFHLALGKTLHRTPLGQVEVDVFVVVRLLTDPMTVPRKRVVIPAPKASPCCGGRLHKLGEDVTETLEVFLRQWTVVQTVREKFSYRAFKRITKPPAPSHPIASGRAGAGLRKKLVKIGAK